MAIQTMGPGVRRFVAAAMVLVLSSSMTGCSLFGYSKQSVTIYSDPTDARVTINGEYAGNTPMTMRVRRRHDAVIAVSKPGFDSQTRVADSSLSTLGIIDIVGGILWLVPLVGLFAGAAYELEPTTMSFTLDERHDNAGLVPAPSPEAAAATAGSPS